MSYRTFTKVNYRTGEALQDAALQDVRRANYRTLRYRTFVSLTTGRVEDDTPIAFILVDIPPPFHSADATFHSSP